MKRQDLFYGDIIQINPSCDDFGGCLMIVVRPKSWGAHGIIKLPGGREVWHHCRFEDVEYIGRAAWVSTSDDDEAA